MLYIPLIIYIILTIVFKKNYLILLLLGLQILSLLCGIFIGQDSSIEGNVSSFIATIVITLATLSLILPWRKYDKIEIKEFHNSKRVNSVTIILLIIGGFTFIVLSIVAYLVVSTGIGDINEFKYVEGTTDFYYSHLPFDVRFYILARICYNYSYFLLPLHFYHQAIGNEKLSRWCGLFSLNIVLYGLTFFSRWTIVLYVSLFLSFWVMFRECTPKNIRLREKKLVLTAGSIVAVLFLIISFTRFGGDSQMGINYGLRIPSTSPIQNPTLYSIFDYLGQSNANGVVLLDGYKGETFGGRWATFSLNELLSGIDLVPPSDYQKYVERLWPDHYQFFNGFTAYTVYDWGGIIAFIFCIAYYLYIRSGKKGLTINKLMVSSLLLQLPLCSIFYSQMNIILYCLVLYSPFALILASNPKAK